MTGVQTCALPIWLFKSNEGMELVQVAILIAIAVALGIIFKTEITSFVNKTFKALNASKF